MIIVSHSDVFIVFAFTAAAASPTVECDGVHPAKGEHQSGECLWLSL